MLWRHTHLQRLPVLGLDQKLVGSVSVEDLTSLS